MCDASVLLGKTNGIRHSSTRKHALFAGLVLLASTGAAQGSIIDLTTGPGSAGVIDGALFTFGNGGGGTGVISPFVRLQSSGTEVGYNSSAASPPFDVKAGSWTHDLRLNEIPIINVDGIDYFEFVLDANEAGGGGNSYLSLDEIQIYTSSVGGQSTTNLASLGTLRYDLDGIEESHIEMDASINSGSGSTDMTAFIPVSAFDGADPEDYVYFYSAFGLQGNVGGRKFGSSAGFEEWAVQINDNSVFVPSPGPLALLGLGALVASSRGRRRREQRAA